MISGRPSQWGTDLKQGWNLAGMVIEEPKEPSIFLSSLEDCYESLWGFNAVAQTWAFYSDNENVPPFLHTLHTIEPGQGYWINALHEAYIEVAPPDNYKIFYLTDHLGSSNIATDISGRVLEVIEYYPYGRIRYQETKKDLSYYKFTGKELDEESDLFYFGARYYDPVVCRFISVDPLEAKYYKPQDFNMYGYCRNNPVNLIDPTGLETSGNENGGDTGGTGEAGGTASSSAGATTDSTSTESSTTGSPSTESSSTSSTSTGSSATGSGGGIGGRGSSGHGRGTPEASESDKDSKSDPSLSNQNNKKGFCWGLSKAVDLLAKGLPKGLKSVYDSFKDIKSKVDLISKAKTTWKNLKKGWKAYKNLKNTSVWDKDNLAKGFKDTIEVGEYAAKEFAPGPVKDTPGYDQSVDAVSNSVKRAIDIFSKHHKELEEVMNYDSPKK